MKTGNGNTIHLHRVFRAPVEVLYRAFTEAPAKSKWLPPYGFTATMHEHDLRVGGEYRMSFANFRTGQTHAFGGEYRELSPNERIRYSDRFDDPSMPGEMTVEITFSQVLCGTEVKISQANIPTQIPVEMCYLGWQESLEQLAKLVEPAIP